ncbi:hypothetical protein Y032_0396g665 [Ancylostoma ceylanicum]|nr:hypothetical protein Y032_0396g665 [Ancylostoma ceylanicum]
MDGARVREDATAFWLIFCKGWLVGGGQKRVTLHIHSPSERKHEISRSYKNLRIYDEEHQRSDRTTREEFKCFGYNSRRERLTYQTKGRIYERITEQHQVSKPTLTLTIVGFLGYLSTNPSQSVKNFSGVVRLNKAQFFILNI